MNLAQIMFVVFHFVETYFNSRLSFLGRLKPNPKLFSQAPVVYAPPMNSSTEDASFKKLALLMTVTCVRNTCIEDFHSRPQGLSDADMRLFNQQVSSKVYTFLRYLLGEDPAMRERLLAGVEHLFPANWDEPSLDRGLVAVAEGKIRSPTTVASSRQPKR